MKVLMVVGQYHPAVGGAEMECRKLAAGLAGRGIGVTVLTQHCSGLPDYEVIDGIPVYRKMKGWHLYEYTYMLSVFWFMLRKSGDYDIIHCFGLYLYTPPAVLMKYILGKRAIGRVEGSGTFGDFHRIKQLTCGRFLLASARRLDRIIAIAGHLVEEIAAAGFPRQRIVSIPNSVDHEHYRPGTDRNRLKNRICFVGRLAKEKGLFCLVDAMQKVSDAIQGTTLTLVGDGPLRQSLAGRVVDLGLQDVVCFNGNGEALLHYQVSDLFVLPSFSEGLSLSLLEALACGLPVIATNVQGNSEVLAPHASAPVIPASGYQVVEYGILVNPGDVEGLASAIQRLLTDTHLAHQFTSRVRSYVRENYALEKIIDDYHALYRSLQ